MADPFIGEIRLFSFNTVPKGWAACNGQLLFIQQNQALFALLGTRYGGNGTLTFALPDLRGRVPLHLGGGFQQGQSGGEEMHTLTIGEIPSHTHIPQGSVASSGAPTPVDNTWGPQGALPYGTTTNTRMGPSAIGPGGGGSGHENRSPFLTLSFCIALTGIFPPRN